MSGRSSLAIVLVSGGMDSCVTAAEASAAGHELAMLHASYGQRTDRRERRAFEEIAAHYEIPVERRLVCELDALKKIGGSSLTDPSIPVSDAPAGALGAGRSGGSGGADGAVGPGASGAIPTSYVPFRNAHFLSMAVSWGEVLGAESVWIGAVEEDSSGYPDCREEYYRAFERLAEIGTRPETKLRVVTPLIRMSKSEIVRRGVTLRAPLNLTWSCYRVTDVACGRCESCVLRLRGFSDAGVDDPLPYRASIRDGS